MDIDKVPMNRWKIRRRRSAYLLLRGAQAIVSRLLTYKKKVSSLVIYPSVPNRQQLGDVLNRLTWALDGGLPDGITITVPCGDGVNTNSGGWPDLPVPDSHYNYLASGSFGKHCLWVRENEADIALKKADLVVLWNVAALRRPNVLACLHRLLIVDPSYYLGFEPYNYAHLRHILSGNEGQSHERQLSLGIFRELFGRFREIQDAYLFVTGPSLEHALDNPVPKNSLRIICNSIVKNDHLLERINPHILTFADPVFHFGVSRYAAEFRRHVQKTMNRYTDCLCVVPEAFASLLRSHFRDFANRIIGMPLRRTGMPNFPAPDAFHVKVTDNILTMFMLPLGTSLAKRIHITGADGRQKNESYYWQHNPSVQFGDLMQTAFDAHPSFTRDRVIEDYYEKHCRILEKVIAAGEARGCTYISETPSYIPTLSKRCGKKSKESSGE